MPSRASTHRAAITATGAPLRRGMLVRGTSVAAVCKRHARMVAMILALHYVTSIIEWPCADL